MTEILSELRSAKPVICSFKKQLISEGVKKIQSGKSSIFDSGGRCKLKNNKKCNEELVARVKAMIDRILLEEIASALTVSSGSSSSALRNRFGYHKVCPYILTPQQKRDGVASLI